MAANSPIGESVALTLTALGGMPMIAPGDDLAAAMLAALDASGQAALTRDLEALLREHNRGGCESLVFPGDYVEVVAVRR
jgi:hypothetical protein